MFLFNNKLLSLLLYVVVFAASARCLTSASNARTNKQKRNYLLLAFILPSILSCFRLCGTDLGLNSAIYCRTIEIPWHEVFATGERPLYFVMMKIAGVLGSFQWFLFFLALIPCVGVGKSLYDSRDKLDLGLAYTAFLFGCLVNSWNITRQYAAIGITCFAVRYVFSRQLWKFLLCVWLAQLFHPSSLVMLAVYPLWTKDQRLPTGWKLFLYYALAIVFVVNIDSFAGRLPGKLGEEYDTYLTDGAEAGKNRDFWVSLLWLVLFLCFRKNLKKLNPQNEYYLALFGLTCIIGLTGFVSPHIKRVALYFSVFRCFLIGSLPLALQTFNDSFERKREKRVKDSREQKTIVAKPKRFVVQRSLRNIGRVIKNVRIRRFATSRFQNGKLIVNRDANNERDTKLTLFESSSAKSARTALYMVVLGLFIITAYILGQAEVLPYRHTGWEVMLGR